MLLLATLIFLVLLFIINNWNNTNTNLNQYVPIDINNNSELYYTHPSALYQYVHQYYQMTPIIKKNNNSFYDYDSKNLINNPIKKQQYYNPKIYRPTSTPFNNLSDNRCNTGMVISSDCIKQRMMQTGSIRDSIEMCQIPSSQSSVCLANKI
jgi:hypothetical protein